jgi:uncharacterized membrane protein YphA (DoxX/SURF4 family)
MGNTNRFWHNEYLALLIRLVLGVMFIYAALDKIDTPAQFARIIYNYHLLPTELINITAIIMPWVEILCGIFLILGIYKEGSVLILNTLLIVFAVAIGINLFRGVDLECGCFTVSSKAKGNALLLLLRDLGTLLLGLYLLVNRSQKFELIRTKQLPY